jgi:hypothetical protein
MLGNRQTLRALEHSKVDFDDFDDAQSIAAVDTPA